MNNVNLIGRITRDPEVRYGQQSGMAIARFSIAIDRGKDKDGKERGADFPNILCFGKAAENCEKYCYKGQLVGIIGRLQTGSYEKDGHKVYTTEVLADRIEYLEWGEKEDVDRMRPADALNTRPSADDVPSGFSRLDDDIPFD